MRKRSGENRAQSVNVPRRMEDIPGLGIIRARGLRKIGINTVADLRASSIELVSSAPGLTVIKAKQVAEYLEQFDADLLLTAAENEHDFLAAGTRAEALQRDLLPHIASSAHDELGTASQLLLLTILKLMTSPVATDFRGSLFRQLTRLARQAITARTLTSDRRRERALNAVNQAVASITKAAESSEVDRKNQVRLCEALQAYADTLSDCLDDRSAARKGGG